MAVMSQAAASSATARGGLRPNSERRRVAAAAVIQSPASPSNRRTSTGEATPPSSAKRGGKSPALSQSKGKKSVGNGADTNGEEGEEVEAEKWKERLAIMEKDFEIIREEKKTLKAELSDLRDKLEEEVWARGRLETKVEELKDKLAEMENENGGGGGGGGVTIERANEVIDKRLETNLKEIQELEKRLSAKIEKRVEERGGGGGGEREREEENRVKQRCVVFTDSNGRDVTHGSIMNHVPRERRDKMETEVVVAYTLEETYRRIDRGEIALGGSTVLIDNLTNDVRGTRSRPAVSPRQLIRLVDRVRRRVMAAGAEAVVVCQLKPMQTADVTPYNDLLNGYLRAEKDKGRDGFGCQTMIRLDSLKADGFHIRPDFISVVARTYACAFLGIEVPDPTPWDKFAPSHDRTAWESDWPRLAGGGANMIHHGR